MPGLHITLVISYQLFVLLEANWHLLDIKLAEILGKRTLFIPLRCTRL